MTESETKKCPLCGSDGGAIFMSFVCGKEGCDNFDESIKVKFDFTDEELDMAFDNMYAFLPVF